MKRTLPGILLAFSAVALALTAAFPAGAQQRDDFGEIRQTVARISYISGDVSFARGDQPDDWQAADRNVPMTLGDRVYTGSRSRIELQVHGGDIIRLGARSDLAALNLTDDVKQFSVRAGIASFQIRDLGDYETWEVDTPNSAVSFEARGDYRIDVDTNGDTRVFVRRGSATVAAGGGQIPVDAGEGIEVYGIDRPQYDYIRVGGLDGWDQWVQGRESRFANARSYRYISADIVGADDLDEYGRWEQVPQYGWAWSPTSVAADWVPYRVGHWIWQDPWGWTWVSAEPWGWAPYHYGRWVVVSSRWYWIPVAPAVRYVDYSPALVAFSGGGPGWSLTVSSGGGGFIGWFPLGPRDPFNPWWGARTGVRAATITNVTYVNRTYITVINRNSFVSGASVTSAWVQDRSVVSQVAAAPIIRGPVPALPTAGALRVAVHAEARPAPRPPAAIVDRAVVVRAAPPPAPPTFQAKLGVIQRNQGAPVEPVAAARISVENRGRPQTITAVRPVVAEQGQVTLQPRSAEGAERGKRPEPVTALRGRPMATTQQPVAANPVTGGEHTGGPPSRERVTRQPVGEPPSQPQEAPAQPRGIERRRIEQPPTPQEQQQEPPSQPRGIERRRIEAPPTPVQQPPESQPRGIERRRIEAQPTPAQQPPESQPRGIERRRIEAPPTPQQQQVPPPQPPQGFERRRAQEPTPQPDNQREGGPRRREAGPPPQQQQQQPPPQQPPPQQPPQGEKPQVQRGRQGNPPEGQQKEKEKGEGKKEERGRKPTPTPQ